MYIILCLHLILLKPDNYFRNKKNTIKNFIIKSIFKKIEIINKIPRLPITSTMTRHTYDV